MNMLQRNGFPQGCETPHRCGADGKPYGQDGGRIDELNPGVVHRFSAPHASRGGNCTHDFLMRSGGFPDGIFTLGPVYSDVEH
jgi:hypothetical protein